MYHSLQQSQRLGALDSIEPRGQPYASFAKFEAPAGVRGEESEYYKVGSETTEAGASDRLSQLSSGNSDEEPHGGFRGVSSKVSKPVSSRPSLDDALSTGTRDFFGWQDDQPEEEKNLVYVEPEEGKRRGGELMSMLFDAPLPKPKVSQRLPPPPAPQLSSDMRPGSVGPYCMQSAQWEASPQYEHPQLDWQQLNAELVSALYDASHVAFGPGQTANVGFLPDGTGYEVWVQGFPAQELERGNGEAVLEELSRALWPTLGNEYLGMVKRQDQQTLQQLPGHRLTLWRSCETETADSTRCWNFVRTGTCARGDRCRWLHEVPATLPVEIKVSAISRYA